MVFKYLPYLLLLLFEDQFGKVSLDLLPLFFLHILTASPGPIRGDPGVVAIFSNFYRRKCEFEIISPG